MNKQMALRGILGCFLIITVLALGLGGPSGCGGGGETAGGDGSGSDAGGGNDSSDGSSVSSSSAEDIAGASAAAVESALSLLTGGNANLSLPAPASLVLPIDKKLTVSATDSCEPLDFGSSPITAVATIYGADISSDGGGSCVVKAEAAENGVSSGMVVALVCDSFSGGSTLNYVSFDGTFGVAVLELLEGGNDASMTTRVGTLDELLVGFVENGTTRVLSLVVNYLEEITITVGESSASYQDSISGCISVGGEPFSISGSRSGSMTF